MTLRMKRWPRHHPGILRRTCSQVDKNLAMKDCLAGKMLDLVDINLSTELRPADKRLGRKISVIEEVAGVPPSDGADDRFMEVNTKVDNMNKNLTAEFSPASQSFGCRPSIMEKVAKVTHAPQSDAVDEYEPDRGWQPSQQKFRVEEDRLSQQEAGCRTRYRMEDIYSQQVKDEDNTSTKVAWDKTSAGEEEGSASMGTSTA